MNKVMDDIKYEINLEEARALLYMLENQFISREPFEHYEHLLRLINGLTVFVASHDGDL